MNNLIQYLHNLLIKKNAKAILVNSTNEYLTEFNPLDSNSRFLLTKFSGSAGEALVTLDKIYLFVDGRYHQQADLEVDHNYIQVVKLSISENFFSSLARIINHNDKLLLVSKKIPFSFYSKFLNISDNIELLDSDPIIDFFKKNLPSSDHSSTHYKIDKIPLTITGKSAASKINTIQKFLQDDSFYFISSLDDIAYITNLRGSFLEYSSSFFAKLLISKNVAILFTDYVINNSDNNLEFNVQPLKNFQTILQEQFKPSCKKVFINKNSINLFDFNLLQSNFKVESQDKISNLKIIKTSQEINHLKYCFKRTDVVIKKVRDLVNSDIKISEYELAQFIENEFKKQGAKKLSFKPIVAFGQNTSIIHYSKPSKDVYLKTGDFVLVDIGAYFDGGYSTDITRTFFRGDSPSIEQKLLYTTVLKAFINAFYSINIKSGFKLDKISRSVINNSKNLGLNGFNFNHGLGHGVGINVHESPPYLSPSKLAKNNFIKPNMVFTIEPGMYKPNYGGVRLENTVFAYISKNSALKFRSFSQSLFEKKLICFNILSKDEKRRLKKWL